MQGLIKEAKNNIRFVIGETCEMWIGEKRVTG